MIFRAPWALTPLAALPLFAALAFTGCTIESEDEGDTSAASDREPWVLVDPASDDDGELRVLVLHDMEGLSGQSDHRTFLYRHTEFYQQPDCQEWIRRLAGKAFRQEPEGDDP